MMVFLYGSEQVISRIVPVLSASGAQCLGVTNNIITQGDWRFPVDMKEIGLVILDTTEIGWEQVYSYFDSSRRIPMTLLVDNRQTDWEEIYNYRAVAYIPINVGDRELAQRINSCVSAAMPRKNMNLKTE